MQLIAQVNKEVPFLEKMIDFAQAVACVHNYPFRIVIPNFRWLTTEHGFLGGRLHLQRRQQTVIEKASLVERIVTDVETLEEYFRPGVSRGLIRDLPQHSQNIFNKYATGKIDKDQMKRMLEISNIPSHWFNRD